MRRFGIVAILLTVVCSDDIGAQVAARQGEPDRDEQQQRFRSPMILDLPLSVIHRSRWGHGQIRSSAEIALRRYTCDGVSFVDFATSARLQRRKIVKVTFDFTLANEPSVDKVANGRFSIVSGEREIAFATLMTSQVEEGRRTVRQVSLDVPEDELVAAPPPTLRIVLHVKVDD